ncbi:hypothetical protein BS47DRAFT_1369740 [Hydnum rufescens UP504]|uniref:Uncharacterized protein n=1 Tax=Hydnum rufescens UP504 TaxID=1448309 RepID=A0A9P6DLF3_9AGAM|nr:hypothetical protein BS47DRAFT_1369740 [Hydnum rufescens UP504]
MTPSPVTFLNPAANAVAVDTWLEDINAFGVRAWKKAKHGTQYGPKAVQGKSSSWMQLTILRGLTLMDPEATLAAHVSNLDLGYINQAYAYKSQFFPEILSFALPAYRKATAAHHFFNSEQFPPVLATPSEQCPRLLNSAHQRPMNMVSFSLDWAEMQGTIHPILSSNLHYHRLLTLMHAQVHRQGKKDIRVNIWPTDGPYDEILHILARLAHNVYGSSATQPLLDETFGVMCKTTTTLFSVPFHLEWRVSECKFSVSPLALTPRHMLQVVIFISGSSLLQYGGYEIKDSDCKEAHSTATTCSSHHTHELQYWKQWRQWSGYGVPAYHGPKSFSCDTDERNQHEVSSPGLLDIQSPPYYDHVIPNHHDTPIHSPHPDSPDTPILDITDGTHDDILLSDDDSDDLVPLKLSEEPSSGEDDEDLKGGPFTIPEVEKIKAEYAALDKRIGGLAREMGRSVNSIQKIGGRVSQVVNPCKTTAWNVFQSSYPTNPDKSVSQSDYTKNTVHPAYDELVKKYGGERSEDWAAESTRMVKEYTETREAITGDITKHGGEVAKIIASHKRAWQKDFRVLASFGVHCELTVLADNACSPAAHAQNGQLFGTVEMESYYKSRLLSHNLRIDGVLPLSHFRLLGSLSIDHYNVSEIQAMYNALENGQLKVSECTHEESNSGETALITDSGGQVLMMVASALEMIGAKKKLDLQRAAEQAVVRAQAVDKRIDGEDSGGDSDGHSGNGPPVRNPSHTVMVNSDRIATQGLGKRPWKGGDDINQPCKMKHLQVKSAEFIDDLDETPTAGLSHLHMQAMSSHHNDVQQHSALSIDSGATVGVPLQHTTGVPVVPTFNPHDPFSMMDDVLIPNGDDMSFPLLDPLLFQGPSLKHL